MLITAAEAIALNTKLTGKEAQLNLFIPIIQNKISQICNNKFLHIDNISEIQKGVYPGYYVDYMNTWADGWNFVASTKTISNANIDFSVNFDDGDDIYISSPRNAGFYTIATIAVGGHSFTVNTIYTIKNETDVGASILLVDWPLDLKSNATDILSFMIFKNDTTEGMKSESMAGYSYTKSEIKDGYPIEIINGLIPHTKPRFV
jgi:hypothetical protein